MTYVNDSFNFWQHSDTDGLADAVSLKDGMTVVVWTLDGNVWFRIVNQSAPSLGPVLKASGPEEYSRAEARVVGDGVSRFSVVWSSWGQDGDGWGIFMRSFQFDGQPITDEQRVNIQWRHFQWKPRLVWCEGTLWALWLTSSVDCTTNGKCTSGPFLRPLFVSRKKVNKMERNLGGNNPIAASLACEGRNGQVVVFWVEEPKMQPKVRIMDPRSFRTVAEAYVDSENTAILDVQETDRTPSSTLLDPQTFLDDQEFLQSGRQLTSDVTHSGISVLTYKTASIILSRDAGGLLTAQTVGYSTSPHMRKFPTVEVSENVQFEQAVWDVAFKPLAIVMCWSAGGRAQGPSSFLCMRKGATFFLHGGSFDLQSTFLFAVLLFLICLFCCLRPGVRIAQQRAIRYTRRSNSAERRAVRMRLQQQLAQIPLEPPVVRTHVQPGSLEMNAVGGENPAGQESVDDNRCSICRHELIVRVALQPCGHTACRDCILRIIEDKSCHICHANVEGVQAVYM